MVRRGATAVLGALVALAIQAGPAPAQPDTPLGHAGRWITDAGGRVVILHGLNMVYKRAPYTPSTTGFGADDATFLRDNGFNTVRLGLIYKAVEPAPGGYDDAYVDDIAATERILADHGVFSLLDFHQDLFNERFQGEGWPDWAVQDDGLPALPQLGFPTNYLGMPALSRAFDHFWANDPGPGGVGLQDRYAAAWRRVAARFAGRQGTLGFDLLNEPWPGSVWPTCANPIGCPLFDATLTAFSRRVVSQIRAAEPQKLVWYEPSVLFDFGADSLHGATGDPQAGFSFHNYCLPGALALPGLPSLGCDALEELVFANAERQAQETGDALMLSEFGASDDLASIKRLVNAADAHMLSWQEWHYCGCDDPTTQAGPGSSQALVIDPSQPPTGSNVKAEKLAVLSRPYPQALAGTPQSYSFDAATKKFRLAYSTSRAGGGSPFRPVTTPSGAVSPASPQTEVFVPAVHYPSGYDVDVQGAVVASPPAARTLRLLSCPGATTVSLQVVPPGQGSGAAPACRVASAAPARRACKRVRVKPRHRHARKRRRIRAYGC